MTASELLRARAERSSEQFGSASPPACEFGAPGDSVVPDFAASSVQLVLERLLRRGRDDVIVGMLSAIPSPKTRLSLFRFVAEASERVGGGEPGVPDERLFCLPLFIEFTHQVPATQLDAALARLVRCHRSAFPPNDGGGAPAEIDLVPNVFEVDDLADLPLSSVRRGATALAFRRCAALPPPHPFVRGNHPQHRSRMFLRYLVGLRRLSAGIDGGSRPGVERSIQNELARLKGTVRALSDGSFHDAIYTGLLMYQARRLTEVAEACALSATPSLASMTAGGTLFRPQIRVRFEEVEMNCAAEYLVRCRPFEDRDRACRRVAEILDRAGMRMTPELGLPVRVRSRL
jgi:hypothetical protein